MIFVSANRKIFTIVITTDRVLADTFSCGLLYEGIINFKWRESFHLYSQRMPLMSACACVFCFDCTFTD